MRPTLDQAMTLHRAGNIVDAIQSYKEILEVEPDSVPVLHNLAIALLQSGQDEDALKYLEAIVSAGTEVAGVFNTLGIVQQKLGLDAEAAKNFQTAVDLNPNDSKALSNLGVALFKSHDLVRAEQALEKAAESEPDNSEIHYNHCKVLRAAGKLEASEQAARRALAISPAHILARVDLGVTLSAQGRVSEAEECYRRAIKLNPETVEAHHYLTHLLLQSERLSEGWREFEWRWKTPEFLAADSFHMFPEWEGEALSEGSLLIWGEQGIGDQIMYASMLPGVEALAAHTVVACAPNLVPLLSRSFPDLDIRSMSAMKADLDQIEGIKKQCPLGSLGQFLRPTMDAFPSRPSYLVADPARAEALRSQYQTASRKDRLVGLSWQSANKKIGAAQSIGLDQLAPILSGGNATFVDLQYGDTAQERAEAQHLGLEVISDPEIDPLADLDAFAAQVSAMDLVITISNTTAHVAGALGIPCWVLLASGDAQNWYWFLDRSDSPWYPSLRLFRQAKPGDWTGVFSDVQKALVE